LTVPWTGDEVVDLRTSGASAMIVPHAGGRLASLTIGDDEVLITDAPPRIGHDWEWGCFALAPWAGIQRGASFEFEGNHYGLETDSRGESWHGLVAERPWEVIKRDGTSATLEIAIGEGTDAPWFTPALVRQHIELEESELNIRLEVWSEVQEMPAVLGLHPWFRRRLDGGRAATVDFRPGSRLVLDHNGRRRRTSDFGGRPWDDVFADVSEPQVSWEGGPAISLVSSAPIWVYYDRADEGFCIEPWSDQDDALSTTTLRARPSAPAELDLTIRWGTR
jgi:aldose 1-epimerase